MSGTNDMQSNNQSTGQKIASHIPGTEANKERKMTQEAGSGMGSGHHHEGAGTMAGTTTGMNTAGAAGNTGYTSTGAGTGYSGAGHHSHGAGGMGTGLAATSGLVGEPTPGRLGEHDHTGTGHHSHHHTGGTGATATNATTGTGMGQTGMHGAHTHSGTGTGVNQTGAHTHSGTGMGSTDDKEGNKESLGTKIKAAIPGTEEHKMKKAGEL
jgi:hypothetical protein